MKKRLLTKKIMKQWILFQENALNKVPQWETTHLPNSQKESQREG
jgi:hypothetical protein